LATGRSLALGDASSEKADEVFTNDTARNGPKHLTLLIQGLVILILQFCLASPSVSAQGSGESTLTRKNPMNAHKLKQTETNQTPQQALPRISTGKNPMNGESADSDESGHLFQSKADTDSN